MRPDADPRVTTGPLDPAPDVRTGPHRHLTWWRRAAVASGAALAADAVLESPPAQLLLLVLALGAFGGAVVAQLSPARLDLAATGRRYLLGALAVGALTLVAVGVGHHAALALGLLACLGLGSPPLWRRLRVP